MKVSFMLEKKLFLRPYLNSYDFNNRQRIEMVKIKQLQIKIFIENVQDMK